MSKITPVKGGPTEGSPAEEAAETAAQEAAEQRKARLVKRYSSAPDNGKKKATSAHLNPTPTKHGATSTGN
jgi:hypothetical protein